MGIREQARWTRARLGRCGPPLDLLTAHFDSHVYAPHAHTEVGPTRAGVITYVNPAVAVAAGTLFLDEELTLGIGVAFTLILVGSVLATAAAPKRDDSRVPWSTRQTSRADGRVESP